MTPLQRGRRKKEEGSILKFSFSFSFSFFPYLFIYSSHCCEKIQCFLSSDIFRPVTIHKQTTYHHACTSFACFTVNGNNIVWMIVQPIIYTRYTFCCGKRKINIFKMCACIFIVIFVKINLFFLRMVSNGGGL